MAINDFSVFFFNEIFFYIPIFIPAYTPIIPVNGFPIMSQPFHRFTAPFELISCFCFDFYQDIPHKQCDTKPEG